MQRSAAKLIRSGSEHLRHLSYKERLVDLKLPTLVYRRRCWGYEHHLQDRSYWYNCSYRINRNINTLIVLLASNRQWLEEQTTFWCCQRQGCFNVWKIIRLIEQGHAVCFWTVNLYNSTTRATLQLCNSATLQLYNSTTLQLYNSATLQLYSQLQSYPAYYRLLPSSPLFTLFIMMAFAVHFQFEISIYDHTTTAIRQSCICSK